MIDDETTFEGSIKIQVDPGDTLRDLGFKLQPQLRVPGTDRFDQSLGAVERLRCRPGGSNGYDEGFLAGLVFYRAGFFNVQGLK